ncbi:hypothetical protein H3N56_10295 [Cetobacterium sp. 2A]|uniref:hypothetical protein n=1 Tax=Cetobacterium sp. 2A TaxID=2754723 RepID=UPI00163CA616|nr:hypothetical protein [Cetobacterium sp. 2A]MBC2856830.1 hypothetical protein [Cetobacterium sp. 2A]
MAKNHIKIQTNIEIIAKDYMKIARVETLAELKNTIYWEYYQKELIRLTNIKKALELSKK